MDILTRRARARLARQRLAAVLAALLLWSAPAGAQGATASALRAALLYNFAHFAEWPADVLPPGKTLSLCVVNDNDVADALEQTIKGRTIEGHELTVQTVEADGPIHSCHLLYVTGLDSKRAAQFLERLSYASVLTVGDWHNFAESGGIVQLFMKNDRMRFAINVTAAARVRLRLSSRLLRLATLVTDEHHANR